MACHSFQNFIQCLKKTFNVRTWEENCDMDYCDMDYCGAKIHRINEHRETHHPPGEATKAYLI